LGGEAAGDGFGFSVAGAGDFNGDGYADVIVGAPYADVGAATDAGKAYVYFGGPLFASREHVTLEGSYQFDRFGRAVAGAGDVNGDGYDDVIVGAPYYDASPGGNEGAARLFLGSSSPGTTYHRAVTGEATSAHLGWSVAGAGDVNGDGYDDVILGAPDFGLYRGRAYIHRGGSSLPSPWTAHATFEGAADYRYFGQSVAGARNVNGDDYEDVVVGAYNYAYVYSGAPSMVGASPFATFTSPAGATEFGWSVAGGGNLEMDTFDDIIVGAPWSAPSGLTYIYRGGNPMSTTPWVTLAGEGSGSLFGYSVDFAGDVSGDCNDDVIVGAYLAASPNPPMTEAGRAYVFFGRHEMRTMPDIVMTGEAAGDHYGYSVAGVGDVNGDGLNDILVGARDNDKGGGAKLADAGAAYLHLSSSPAVRPDISSVRDVPGDQGGKVTVSWKRSSLDHPDFDVLVDYSIHRSPPPAGGVYVWEPLATLAGYQSPTYSYTASTLQDSTADTSGVYCFRVVARSYPPLQFWYSDTVAGYSVDNLPPAPPLMLAAEVQPPRWITLRWDANRVDHDVQGYRIHRSVTAGFIPDAGNVVGSVT
ncbi:MAG: FG-GAP-like repeat-containing protein, partial [Bacteroidota bacterium]